VKNIKITLPDLLPVPRTKRFNGVLGFEVILALGTGLIMAKG
jgi:hypothetical protein